MLWMFLLGVSLSVSGRPLGAGLSATNQVGVRLDSLRLWGQRSIAQAPSPKLSYSLTTAPDSAAIPDAALGGWEKTYTHLTFFEFACC